MSSSSSEPQGKPQLDEATEAAVIEKSKDKGIVVMQMATSKLAKWRVKGSITVEVEVLILTLSYKMDVDFSEPRETKGGPGRLGEVKVDLTTQRGEGGDETIYLKPDQIRDPVGSSPRNERVSANWLIRKINDNIEDIRIKLIESAQRSKAAGITGTIGVKLTFGVPKILTFGEEVNVSVGVEVAITDMLAAQEAIKRDLEKRCHRLDVTMKKVGHIKEAGTTGSLNLYAVVSIEGGPKKDRRRTKTVSGTPEGDVAFRELLPPLPVAPKGNDEELVITLYNSTTFGSDFVDEIIVKLDTLDLTPGKTQDVWAVLKKLEDDDKPAPFILFSVKLSEVLVTDADVATAPVPAHLALAPVGSGPFNLKMKVIEAKGLKAADKSGTSDPYVKINSDKSNFKTKVVKETLNPTWNEEFQLAGVTHQTIVYGEVWDQNRFKDEFLGAFSVRAGMVRNTLENPINAGKPYQDWIALAPKDDKHPVSGQVHVQFTF